MRLPQVVAAAARAEDVLDGDRHPASGRAAAGLAIAIDRRAAAARPVLATAGRRRIAGSTRAMRPRCASTTSAALRIAGGDPVAQRAHAVAA